MKNGGYIMKKVILSLILALSLTSVASANDYSKAVLGHVVQSEMNGTSVDHSKLLEQEMQKIAYVMTLQMIGALQEHMPAILDGMASDLRQKADAEYKCELLKDTKIQDKQCQ